MAKDSFYFSHDYNARNDRKIAALVKEYRSAGYGIFWATCEMMHEEGGSLEFDNLTIEALAKDLNEEPDLVQKILTDCISRFKLFEKDLEFLQSKRVQKNLHGKNEKREDKAKAGREGGIKSGESRKYNSLLKQNEALLQSASSSEPNESKESKEIKESKVNEINGASPLPVFDFKLWTSEKQTFLNSEKWQYQFCTEKNVGQQILKKWMVEFITDIELREEFKDVKALRSHFTNWYNLKNKKYSQNGKGTSNDNAKYES